MPFNSIFSWLMKKRVHQIDLFRKYPYDVQRDVFRTLISKAKETEWGKQYDYASINSIKDFQQRVPLQEYDHVKPYVDRLIKDEQNLLWPTPIKWFAKSSGTTTERSKLIPVSREAIEDCHYKGGKDLVGLYYSNHPEAALYAGKNLTVGGSSQVNTLSSNSYTGDLSAIIIKNLPWWAEIKRVPRKDIALMDNWEEKIDAMARTSIKQDVVMISGVPSWSLVLMNHILDITGKKSIAEVWPNLELFVHGGVSFKPYRPKFEHVFGDPKINFVETYNASEGFFGIQDTVDGDDMLLMLDYGIFYEFIPMDDYKGIDSTNVLPLEEVEPGINYAVVISTNAGLWRYIIGDTVTFTSKEPHRIQVTGRTRFFINTFGEELIVDNAEKALKTACDRTGAVVTEYTAGPVYMDENAKNGGHEWLIEFEKEPENMAFFTEVLDNALKSVNTDYEAKRSNNLTLNLPKVQALPSGTFYDWMKKRGKLGGQNKVPRLYNSRKFLDDIHDFVHARSTD